MSRRVFWHIGLPKTGTSYLQAILWPQRDVLARHGLLVPGREKRDHLLASMIVRDYPGVARRGPGADAAWDVVCEQIAGHDGDALLSHEFFCAASAPQVARAVADLEADGAQVHVVVTAREPLGLFTSSWQESLKNKGTTPLAAYGAGESDDPRDVWDWRALDLGLVLGRWATAVPPERLHVLVTPGSDEPRSRLWELFCGVLGLDPGVVVLPEAPVNGTMGVIEAELVRRLNGRLTGRWNAYDRGRWLRTHLADQRLVPRQGERFWPDERQVAECRARGERAVALLGAEPFDVVGDVADLLVPTSLPERRHPDTVTDAEVADAALDVLAGLLGDLRDAGDSGGPGDRPPTRDTQRRRRWPRAITRR